MGTHFVISNYRRYKAGQAKLVKWLWDSTHPPTAVRQQPGAHKSTTTKLTTLDLIAFAKQIVAAIDPKIDIPIEMLDVMKDVISGRKLCAEWYATFKTRDNTANEQHMYFIQVLEQIFETLRREHKKRLPKRKKKVAILATDVDDLSNHYCHLGLEELNEDESASGAGNQKSTKNVKTEQTHPADEPEYKFEDPVDEKFMAMWALLSDTLEARKHVRAIWKRHVSKELSLLAAGVLTNQAMVNCLEADFLNSYPDLKPYAAMIDLIGTDWYLDELLALHHPEIERPPTLVRPPVSECESASDLLCIDAWLAITDFQRLQAVRAQAPTDPRIRDLKPRLKFTPHPFTAHLFTISGDFIHLLHQIGREISISELASLDEITRAFYLITGAHTVTLSSVCAMQIYMDIHDILGGQLSCGIQECLTTMQRIENYLQTSESYYQHASAYTQAHCPPSSKQSFARLRAIFSAASTSDDDTAWKFQLSQSARPLVLRHSMLQILPLLALQIAYDLLGGFHDCAFVHADGNLVVFAAAHLYQGIKLWMPQEGEWADLERFIEMQNRHKTFARRCATSIDTVAKQYSMAQGLSLSQVSRTAKPGRPNFKHSLKHVPKIELPIQLMGEFHNPPNLQAELSLFYEHIKRYATTVGIKDSKIDQQWRTTKRLSSRQLLEVLQEVFLHEEPHLQANILGLANACSQFLSRVSETRITNNQASSRPRHRVEVEIMSDLVWHALWDTTIVERRGRPKENEVLFKAGSELRRTLEETNGGQKFIIDTLNLYSGHSDTPNHQVEQTPRAPPDLTRHGFILGIINHPMATTPIIQAGTQQMSDLFLMTPTYSEWSSDHANPTTDEYKTFVNDLWGATKSWFWTHHTVEDLELRIQQTRKSPPSPSKVFMSVGLEWQDPEGKVIGIDFKRADGRTPL